MNDQEEEGRFINYSLTDVVHQLKLIRSTKTGLEHVVRNQGFNVSHIVLTDNSNKMILDVQNSLATTFIQSQSQLGHISDDFTHGIVEIVPNDLDLFPALPLAEALLHVEDLHLL